MRHCRPSDRQERLLGGLEAEQLHFQRCADCGNAWLPARTECPQLLVGRAGTGRGGGGAARW